MKNIFKSILFVYALSNLISCSDNVEPKFEFLKLNSKNQIEFLENENMTLKEFGSSIDSILHKQKTLYLRLDIHENSSYGKFYSLRKVLQKSRHKLLISLANPIDQINYYTISEEPKPSEIERFTTNQIIKINHGEKNQFSINQDSSGRIENLSNLLWDESLNMLSKQSSENDKVLMFWINLDEKTTNNGYRVLGRKINETIQKLKEKNPEIITRIIELKIKN